MTRRTAQAFVVALVALLAYVALGTWETTASNRGPLVVYFARPSDTWRYLRTEWAALASSAFMCLLVASMSLLLSALASLSLLVAGLYSTSKLRMIERSAAYSQTVPTLVVVTISLLAEKQLFKTLGITVNAHWYCVFPVTLALMFPPLANGAGAINRAPLQLKELLRLWAAPPFWRIRRVYLPLVLPDILTGVRSSATWAVGATLITEGLLNGVEGDSTTLGRALMRPFSAGEPGKTLSVLLIASALGYLLYAMVVRLQEVLERWLLGQATEAADAYPLQGR